MDNTSYVLMTAMPPTVGHSDLIRYAANLSNRVVVVLCTQPDEPYANERQWAIQDMLRNGQLAARVRIHRIHRTLPQEPEEAVDFWDMWAGFLEDAGITDKDYIVASETYGVKLAEVTGTTFMPYDMGRALNSIKATYIRNNPYGNFERIMPEFQVYLRKTITIFGAESCGKTSTANWLGSGVSQLYPAEAMTVFEWARPYLETVGAEITLDKMNAIWQGQKALQLQARDVVSEDIPLIVQDTDLFSTVGYWMLQQHEFNPEGPVVPYQLIEDALLLKSDLYIIMSSEIPFEENELRYGGHQRESDDEFWISLCKRYKLPYVYITGHDYIERLLDVCDAIKSSNLINPDALAYQRSGKEYEQNRKDS